MRDHIKVGISYLRKNDPILSRLIDKHGSCNLKPSNSFFKDLVYSIVSQQLSIKAANSIYNKMRTKVPDINPIILKNVDLNELKASGLSNQKATYVKGLAEFFLKNTLVIDGLNLQSDDEIITELCKIKGVGVWTAQMFLIFSLNRLDVLPIDDVGFKRAIIKNYSVLNDNQLKNSIIKISQNWGVYKSIAAWYLWRDIDNN